MEAARSYGLGAVSPPSRLPPGAIDHLDMVEGTLKIGYSARAPLTDPPKVRTPLVEDETPAKTKIHIDLDENLWLHFVRRAPEQEPADVSVDISPLKGAMRLDIFCIWSPTELAIQVVDRDNPQRNVRNEIGPNSP